MKIAVLIPGHFRTWTYCKENFIQTICDSNHHIDIFAIGNSAAMKKYGLRSKITNRIEIFEQDDALCNFVVDPDHKIPLSLVRLADNNKVKIQSFIPTRHSIPTD